MFDDRIITVINELSEEFSVDWDRKLELTKQQALTAQGHIKTNPRIVVELLEKVMILQAFNSQGCFSTETAIRHFQGKIDKQRMLAEDKAPNIAGYIFSQVWASLIYTVITIGLLLVFTGPVNWYCNHRISGFCKTSANFQHWIVGDSK